MSLLTAIALDVGAPALINVLRNRGGAAGGVVADVADAALRKVGKALGTEPTEEAIVAKYQEDPEAVTTAIQQVDAEIAAVAQAASDATQSYHQILQADAQSEKLLNRIWRPLNGILFAFSSAGLVFCFCRLMLQGDVETIQSASVAYGFLGTVLGTWAGVVGVYVWRRTDEKKARAA